LTNQYYNSNKPVNPYLGSMSRWNWLMTLLAKPNENWH